MRHRRRMGFGQEHLIRRFREQVGLTPKVYANIQRFDRALELARARTGSWSQHLVRDFKRYANLRAALLGPVDASWVDGCVKCL
jgi:methylphosphotriester-DNA--protein-cysteine methyltransferase